MVETLDSCCHLVGRPSLSGLLQLREGCCLTTLGLQIFLLDMVCYTNVGLMQDIKKDVEQRLAAHRDNAAMSQPGKDWVRGWDDWNRAPGPNAMAAPERKE